MTQSIPPLRLPPRQHHPTRPRPQSRQEAMPPRAHAVRRVEGIPFGAAHLLQREERRGLLGEGGGKAGGGCVWCLGGEGGAGEGVGEDGEASVGGDGVC